MTTSNDDLLDSSFTSILRCESALLNHAFNKKVIPLLITSGEASQIVIKSQVVPPSYRQLSCAFSMPSYQTTIRKSRSMTGNCAGQS